MSLAAPTTWVTGEIVTAAKMNAEIFNQWTALEAAWTTYSPALTNVSSGAGTFSYLQIGKTLLVRGNFTAGTATATAAIQIALPLSLAAAWSVVISAQNNNALIGSNATASGTTIRVFKDTAATSWTAGDSIANVHYNGVLETT